jgi:hypothetical protein
MASDMNYTMPMAQGDMVEITDPESVEAVRDNVGFTHPNLHRRTTDGVTDRTYRVSVHGVNSYRYTEYAVHDEESTISEIP